MWKELRNDKEVVRYFPDYSEKRFPNKRFLMNVINTIKPNSIITAIKKIKQHREDKQKNAPNQAIVITAAYMNLLKEFECLGDNFKV